MNAWLHRCMTETKIRFMKMAEEHIGRKNINRGFRKLDIWQLSIVYYKMIVTVMSRCVSIPYKVKAQIEDSALSISSNIAEDYARRSPFESLDTKLYEIENKIVQMNKAILKKIDAGKKWNSDYQ